MVADYADKPKRYFHFERREMLHYVSPSARDVLEIGCGEADFASALKSSRSVHVTGIEPFAKAAAIAAQRIDRTLNMDVDSGLLQREGQQFDCIVCNDVLEHLTDPWAVLTRLHGFLRQGGSLVISLPSVRYMPVLKDLLLQSDFRYTDMGVMDRTHLRFFTQKSMKRMFEECGFHVEKIEGINATPFPWKFALFNKLLFGAFSDARFPQYAAVLKPEVAAETPRA